MMYSVFSVKRGQLNNKILIKFERIGNILKHQICNKSKLLLSVASTFIVCLQEINVNFISYEYVPTLCYTFIEMKSIRYLEYELFSMYMI